MFLPKNRSTKSFSTKVILILFVCVVLFIGYAFISNRKDNREESQAKGQQQTTIISKDSKKSGARSAKETDHSAAKTQTEINSGKKTQNEAEVGAQSAEALASKDSSFHIWFLDVGQADFEVVECDGHYMTIDGGNAADSQFVYSFLDKQGIEDIDYAVVTHAHEDHCGAVAAILNHSNVGTIYCPVTSYSTKTFKKMVETIEKQGKSITVPQAGNTFSLGSASVEILGPINSYSDVNDTSIVLKISYGNTTYMMTGDAGRESEKDIIDAGYDVTADVLKVGHHGSETASSYIWLREVEPTYAVISSNREQAPEYDHPHESTISRLRDADVTVYRTDMQGSIELTSDGTNIDFSVERNPDADTLWEAR